MQSVSMTESNAGGEVMRQRSFHADCRLHRIGGFQILGQLIDAHRSLEGRQGVYRWNVGEGIQDRRIGDDELLLSDPVESTGRQSQVLAYAIIEDTEAATNCGLRGMLPAHRAGLPRETKPRREIQITADVIL